VADVARATAGDVRAILRRRRFDDAGFRLALDAADAGTAWVARDDGECIGIAIAFDSEDERYVGDLFVEPSYRGQGIGAQLLAVALDDSDDRDRALLLDSSDPAALALAFRFGVIPGEPILHFTGAIPREEELAKMAAGDYRFAVDAISPGTHVSALDELDCHARGTMRPAAHAGFARDATGHAFFLNGEFVAYAYVWADGRVGALAAASEAYLVQVFAYALVTLQRTYGASWCSLLVPASNRRIARAALRAGLRIDETAVVGCGLTSSLSNYIGYHRLLF
jgi:GNAT superfamily N-acetyltransferase